MFYFSEPRFYCHCIISDGLSLHVTAIPRPWRRQPDSGLCEAVLPLPADRGLWAVGDSRHCLPLLLYLLHQRGHPLHVLPQVSSLTINSHVLPQVSSLTITSHVLPQVSSLTITSHVLPPVSSLTITSHVLPQVSSLTITSHVLPPVSSLTITSHVLPQVSSLTINSYSRHITANAN